MAIGKAIKHRCHVVGHCGRVMFTANLNVPRGTIFVITNKYINDRMAYNSDFTINIVCSALVTRYIPIG